MVSQKEKKIFFKNRKKKIKLHKLYFQKKFICKIFKNF
jgi:hypothetical protein